MRDAIAEGLAAAADSDGAPGKGGADKPVATGGDKGKAPADELAGKAAADQGGAKTGAEGEEGKKPAKADDFQLTAEEKRNLTPKAIGRFHELHRHAKAVESRVDELSTVNTQLSQARDAIVSVLQETQTTDEELAGYLNFNHMLKSGNHAAALEMVEGYRTQLLKLMGKEAPGYDPIAEHQDLAQMVDDGDMTRAAALEVAQARQVKARVEAQRRAAEESSRGVEASQQEQEAALAEIETWTRQMAASDKAFSTKSAILGPKLQGLWSRYPAKMWPTVLKDAYDMITVPTSQGDASGSRPAGDQTLRPRSGNRPGGPLPKSMLEAISLGLGHTGR